MTATQNQTQTMTAYQQAQRNIENNKLIAYLTAIIEWFQKKFGKGGFGQQLEEMKDKLDNATLCNEMMIDTLHTLVTSSEDFQGKLRDDMSQSELDKTTEDFLSNWKSAQDKLDRMISLDGLDPDNEWYKFAVFEKKETKDGEEVTSYYLAKKDKDGNIGNEVFKAMPTTDIASPNLGTFIVFAKEEITEIEKVMFNELDLNSASMSKDNDSLSTMDKLQNLLADKVLGEEQKNEYLENLAFRLSRENSAQDFVNNFEKQVQQFKSDITVTEGSVSGYMDEDGNRYCVVDKAHHTALVIENNKYNNILINQYDLDENNQPSRQIRKIASWEQSGENNIHCTLTAGDKIVDNLMNFTGTKRYLESRGITQELLEKAQTRGIPSKDVEPFTAKGERIANDIYNRIIRTFKENPKARTEHWKMDKDTGLDLDNKTIMFKTKTGEKVYLHLTHDGEISDLSYQTFNKDNKAIGTFQFDKNTFKSPRDMTGSIDRKEVAYFATLFSQTAKEAAEYERQREISEKHGLTDYQRRIIDSYTIPTILKQAIVMEIESGQLDFNELFGSRVTAASLDAELKRTPNEVCAFMTDKEFDFILHAEEISRTLDKLDFTTSTAWKSAIENGYIEDMSRILGDTDALYAGNFVHDYHITPNAITEFREAYAEVVAELEGKQAKRTAQREEHREQPLAQERSNSEQSNSRPLQNNSVEKNER